MRELLHASHGAWNKVVCMPEPPTNIALWVVDHRTLEYYTQGEDAEYVPCPECAAWVAMRNLAALAL